MKSNVDCEINFAKLMFFPLSQKAFLIFDIEIR